MVNIEVPSITHAGETAIRLFLMINTFEIGGSERQFIQLSQSVCKPGFQVHLGCVSRRGPLAEEEGDILEFRLGGSLYGWQSIRTRMSLARHLRSHKIQIAHAFDFYTNLTLIPAARLAGVQVVIGSQRQLGDLLTPAKLRVQTAAFRWCDAVVCNSQAAADRLRDLGVPADKLMVIGNALDSTAFEATSPALPRSGALRVGMVARMNAHSKNHTGFLRIAAEIHRRMPEVEFLLVGDGPLRPEFERQAAGLGLRNRVIFVGERRDIPAVLASMDVAVLTSESESLSNAILEAMAALLPVVAYNVGGNAELIKKECGFLIEASNENEFANAVSRLLSDATLRQRLGENARRFAEENFKLDRIRNRYEELYMILLEAKCRRKVPQ
jgi:L-malate glycosyltransferase